MNDKKITSIIVTVAKYLSFFFLGMGVAANLEYAKYGFYPILFFVLVLPIVIFGLAKYLEKNVLLSEDYN